MKINCIAFLATMTLFAGKVAAQQSLPLDPQVRHGRLANGFTYYIRHNPEPAKRVLVYFVNNVGSVLETDEQQGLAHFMEHMSFNGTVHYPKNALVDYLQKAGLRFGADINAHTAFDETIYQLPLPSDKPDILKNGLQIVHDWAQFATLDSEEIDKERGVVLEEERMRNGVAQRLQQAYWKQLLNHSRYTERIPIGIDSILRTFRPETIRSFYHDWYRPDLQAVVIVGDVDADQMEKEIKATFADLKNPDHEKARTKYAIPLTGKNQYIVATDPEMTGTEMQIYIKQPGHILKTDSDFAEQLRVNIFDQLLGQRLSRLTQEANPPFLQAKAGIQSFFGGLDAFSASVGAKPGELERGVKALWAEIARVERFGFTQPELDRAKNGLLNGYKNAEKEKDKTPSSRLIDAYVEHFLRGSAAPGITATAVLMQQLLPGVTLAQLNEVAVRYIVGTNRDILLMAPEKDKANLPGERMVLNWLKAASDSALTPYKEEVSVSSLLSHEPVSGKIIAESHDERLGLTRLTLSNGIKVLLKPTTFKNDQIAFRAFSPGGTSVVADEDFPSANAAIGLVTSAGVGNFDLNQLRQWLSGKQALVIPTISERSQGISGSTTPQDLETTLQLVYAYMTEPRRDTTTLQNFLQRSRAGLVNRGNNPTTVFNDTISSILGGYNFRRTPPSLDKLDAVSLDKAYRFYQQAFGDAGAFTFTFVGSIDTAAIKPLLEKYLGSLPSTHAGLKARDLDIHLPIGPITRILHKGSDSKATVDLVFAGNIDYTPENILKLDALKECLQIRMIQRLREEESGVYSPSVRLNTARYPEAQFAFVISFTCAPENSEKLIASALDEIKQLKAAGPAAENLEKWKASDREERETRIKTNSWWLSYLTGQLESQDDLYEMYGHDAIVDKITVEELKKAADKWIDTNSYYHFELRPEKNK